MSEFRGTPGPWKAVNGKGSWKFAKPSREIHGPRGEILAILIGHGANDEAVPESNLMAASPDLLAALQACENALAPVMANHECGDMPESGKRCGECLGCMNWATWEMAHAAIRKALGDA